MLFFFFYSISCVYWEFNPKEYEELKKHSYEKPILMLFYSTKCPHCNGIKELVDKYTVNRTAGRNDSYVALVNCLGPDHYCRKYDIHYTPSMFLVIGPDKRYWPKITEKSIEKWDEAIDKYLYNDMNEIKEIGEIKDNETLPFVLETKNNETKEFMTMAKIAKKYKLFDDKFYYIIKDDINESKLYTINSPNCTKVYDPKVQRLDEFIEQNKFGPKHNYNLDEYNHIPTESISLIIDANKDRVANVTRQLTKLSDGFCGKMLFGYSDDENLRKKLDIKKDDMPVFVYSTPKCVARTNADIFEAIEAHFFEEADKGKICNNDYFLGPVSNQLKIPGYHVVFVYVTVILSLTLILRTDNINDENAVKFE